MLNDSIHFIITGGTIDSYYKGSIDTVVLREKSIIPEYIKDLQLYQEIEFSEICMKDSRDLTREDLKNICIAIDNSIYKKIIVTHGTYTMPNTAKFLQENLKDKEKVIIITGAMIPLGGFSPTDASFNLGFAIAKSQNLENGIYVCMNGKVFSPDEVFIPQKKMEFIKEGRFTSMQ